MRYKFIILLGLLLITSCTNIQNLATTDSKCENYETDLKISCYYKKALETKDYSYCYNFYSFDDKCQNVLGREICYDLKQMDNCILSIAGVTKNPEVCEAKFKDKENEAQCQKIVQDCQSDESSTPFCKPLSELSCERIYNDEQRVKCINEIGLLTGRRIEECERLPRDNKYSSTFYLKDACYIKKAIQLNDISLCNPENTGLDEYSNTACIIDMAIHHNNKKYCDDIDYEKFAVLKDPLTLEKCHQFVVECKDNPELHNYCTHEQKLCEGFSEKKRVGANEFVNPKEMCESI